MSSDRPPLESVGWLGSYGCTVVINEKERERQRVERAVNEFLKDMIPLDPDIARAVDEEFWGLLE